MLKEVIIVEGKMDTLAVKRALDADTIETGGFTLSKITLDNIAAAYQKRGIIILTDPDGAGERIRRFLTKRFPNAAQAFVPKLDATANNDVGIEQASPRAIQMALEKVHYTTVTPNNEFSIEDLLSKGLTGSANSAQLRAKAGATLGIGYANAKKFLERLNHYNISREEFNKATEPTC